VKPLVRAAKEHFRPDAVPMLAERKLVFRRVERLEPDLGAEVKGCGPERGTPGRYHCSGFGGLRAVEEGEVEGGEGGPPMMPPSINRISGAFSLNRSSIFRAVLGAIAFRSR